MTSCVLIVHYWKLQSANTYFHGVDFEFQHSIKIFFSVCNSVWWDIYFSKETSTMKHLILLSWFGNRIHWSLNGVLVCNFSEFLLGCRYLYIFYAMQVSFVSWLYSFPISGNSYFIRLNIWIVSMEN